MIGYLCAICRDQSYNHDVQQDNPPTLYPTPGDSALKNHVQIVHFGGYNPPPLDKYTEIAIQALVNNSVQGIDGNITIIDHMKAIIEQYDL